MNVHYEPAKTTVCVMGLGYIGLPTASILATKGYSVIGVDVRADVVETINRGEIHIVEPDLDILVRSAVNSGQLKARTEPEQADVFIICVPTPIRDDKSADLSYIESASKVIRPYVKSGDLVILESTSPPETTHNLVAREAIPDELTIGDDVFVAHCPERVLPGRILFEVVQNDRVVGGMTPSCTDTAVAFYTSFVAGEVLPTSAVSAETIKLVENSFRDVNIAFANELSVIADKLDVDVWEIIELANRHPRVQILNPGPGVGGHCISVDPWFLASAFPEEARLIRAAREINDGKPAHVVQRIRQLASQFASPVIGCLGITYKADVDDLRESPSLEIVQQLRSIDGLEVLTADPHVSPEKFDEFPIHPLNEILERSQILVLLTDHKVFKHIPKKTLQEKVLVDTRGVWR